MFLRAFNEAIVNPPPRWLYLFKIMQIIGNKFKAKIKYKEISNNKHITADNALF